MSVEQGLDLKTAKRIAEIIPGLRSDLKEAWNRLLWEPNLEPGVPMAGYPVETPWVSNRIAGKPFGIKHIKYVSPKGKLLEATFEQNPTDDKVYLTDKPEELDLQEYVRLAPQAEQILIDLVQSQDEELRELPEGREILWHPQTWRFGFLYTLDPNEEQRVLIVRAKKVGHEVKLFCPNHRSKGLLLSHPRQDTLYSSRSLQCVVDPNHFSIPVNPSVVPL